MRFSLVAVAVAVLPSVFSFPVFKRSDTSLNGKDQKSERKTTPGSGITATISLGGSGCQTGAINYNSNSLMSCNFGNGQPDPQQQNPNPFLDGLGPGTQNTATPVDDMFSGAGNAEPVDLGQSMVPGQQSGLASLLGRPGQQSGLASLLGRPGQTQGNDGFLSPASLFQNPQRGGPLAGLMGLSQKEAKDGKSTA